MNGLCLAELTCSVSGSGIVDGVGRVEGEFHSVVSLPAGFSPS